VRAWHSDEKERRTESCSEQSQGAMATMDNFTWSFGSFSPLLSWPGSFGAYDQVLRDIPNSVRSFVLFYRLCRSSLASAFRKSSKARFPANSAAVRD
jgi:hypothetical protein